MPKQPRMKTKRRKTEMIKRIRLILITCLLIAIAAVITSCSNDTVYDPPYDSFNKDGYNISIRYDASLGSEISDNIRYDVYRKEDFKVNADGKLEITLIDPSDESRGEGGAQAFKKPAATNGYSLVGWYEVRHEKLDENGNTVYTYEKPWDFSTSKLTLDPNKEFDANDPELTLYAAWVRNYEFNFNYLNEDGTPVLTKNDKGEDVPLVITESINPVRNTPLSVPSDNTATGEIGSVVNDFPDVLTDYGYRYSGVYYDKSLTSPVTDSLKHTGSFNITAGEWDNGVMDVYCVVRTERWFNISSIQQFTENAYANANYILHTDLDFGTADDNGNLLYIWPTLFTSNSFSGSIIGNGYSIKNVTISQDSASSSEFGLFGKLSNATVENVTFENITLNVNAGSRKQGSGFGILAGTANGSFENVKLINSKLVISSDIKETMLKNIQFGLISSSANVNGITWQDCSCEFTADGKYAYEASTPDAATGIFSVSKKSEEISN